MITNQPQQDRHASVGQLIWGIALVVAGVGVFYRIPQVMPQIETIKQFSSATGVVRFCFYIMGVILIGGGMKKISAYYKAARTDSKEEE